MRQRNYIFDLLGYFILLFLLGFLIYRSFVNPHRCFPVQGENTVDTVLLWYSEGTTYYPEPRQTDKSPFKTANGMLIDKRNPISSRIVAFPREALINYNPNGKFRFKDTILVKGDCPYAGKWIIGDVLSKRISKKYPNRVDFCVGKHNEQGLWKNLTIEKAYGNSKTGIWRRNL